MSAARPYFHDMDAVRATLMLLGVPYHVTRSYSENEGYGVQSPDTSLVLSLLSSVLHSFRMEAFFVVAGLFAAMVMARGARGSFLTSRLLRIGLPMAACLLLLPPLGQLVAAAMVDAGLATPAAAARVVAPAWLWWVMHLWFLGTLMMLTLALVIAATLVDRWPPAAALAARLGAGLGWLTRRRFVISGVVLAVLVAMVWAGVQLLSKLIIGLGWPAGLFGPLFSFEQVGRFAPFFLFGTALWYRPDLRAWFSQPEPWSLPLALAGSLLFAARGYLPALQVLALVFGVGFAGVFWTQWLVSFAVRFLDRPSPRRAWLADSSYTVYLFHYPIVMALCLLFVGIALPPVAEFAIITLIALALSFGLFAIVRRSPILELLFNGKPLKRRVKAVP